MKLFEFLLKRIGVESSEEERSKNEEKKKEVSERKQVLSERIEVLKIQVAIQTRDYRD